MSGRDDPDGLRAYREKRDFARTGEPAGDETGTGGPVPVFVIQKHAARRLHYDLRLEIGGVLASWAVPKGPSTDPARKRLAVRTEDHPLDYAGFEGVIPAGEYGGGTVMVWDRGIYENLRAAKADDGADMPRSLADGTIEVRLEGEKLRGAWALVRTRGRFGKPGDENWLLIKKRDAEADPGADVTGERPDSVLTGRSLDQIAEEEDAAAGG